MRLRNILMAGVAATALALPAAASSEQIRIGYISTLSGPAASLGQEMLNAYQLALELNDGQFGGIPVELVIGDDQSRPQVGVQLARQMLERDDVHFFSGLLFGHVVEAVNSAVQESGKLIVGQVGGSAELAGERCHENFFMASWTTDTMFEAIGAHLASEGIERVVAVATNYSAGWDAVAGLKRGYGQDLAGEILVRLDQNEFGAELSQIRATAPEAVVTFMPGGSGIAFARQFHQSGLGNTVRPFAATFQADETTFRALGDAALGMVNAGPWNPYLENAANERFVEAYREKFGFNPSILAAMAYDTAMILDQAIGAIDGDVEDTDRFREALRTVEFESIRGNFRFNNNHFPVQDFFLSVVEEHPDGGMHNRLITRVFENRADSHHESCPMN